MHVTSKYIFAFFGVALVISGCGKSHSDGAAAAASNGQSSPAGSSDDAGPPSIKRYDDEVLVDHRPLVVTGYANALAAVPKGTSRAVLNKGDAVVAIATHDGFYLVLDEKSHELGWVAHFAFDVRSETPEKLAVIPKCAAPQVLISQSRVDAARCAYECASTPECGDDATCDAAILLDANGLVTLPEMYSAVCTSSRDAGTDAKSVPSLFGAAHGMDGACAKGFSPALDYGKLCYRTCKTGSDCPAGASCKKGKDVSLCFAN